MQEGALTDVSIYLERTQEESFISIFLFSPQIIVLVE